MDTNKLERFLNAATDLSSSLDAFVDEQRNVGKAVRAKDWAALEKALAQANGTSELVAFGEEERNQAWNELLAELGLPADSSVFRASLALPLAARASLTDSYRSLRLSAMRARIENDALGSFVGSSASILSKTIEELFPERKGRVYGKSGKPRALGSDALVLNAAF
ncbi:MAG TPA: hypothetical protein DCG47_11190 [Spirochaetaceae bacterium]|nr:hypothetical protein [Spirochaetaceae bacterium]